MATTRSMVLLCVLVTTVSVAACGGNAAPSAGDSGPVDAAGARDASERSDSGGSDSEAGRDAGPVVDASVGPREDSSFASGGYGVTTDWRGYLFTQAEPGAVSTIMPACGPADPCFAAAGAQLCAGGTLAPEGEAFGMIAFNLNQAAAPPNPAGDWVLSGTGLVVDVQNRLGGRLQVVLQSSAQTWCFELPSTRPAAVAWRQFRRECGPGGTDTSAPPPGTALRAIAVRAVGGDASPRSFDFCLVDVDVVR